jgi:hypothetical protein
LYRLACRFAPGRSDALEPAERTVMKQKLYVYEMPPIDGWYGMMPFGEYFACRAKTGLTYEAHDSTRSWHVDQSDGRRAPSQELRGRRPLRAIHLRAAGRRLRDRGHSCTEAGQQRHDVRRVRGRAALAGQASAGRTTVARGVTKRKPALDGPGGQFGPLYCSPFSKLWLR